MALGDLGDNLVIVEAEFVKPCACPVTMRMRVEPAPPRVCDV